MLWSPEQIAGWLTHTYRNDPSLHVSHETFTHADRCGECAAALVMLDTLPASTPERLQPKRAYDTGALNWPISDRIRTAAHRTSNLRHPAKVSGWTGNARRWPAPSNSLSHTTAVQIPVLEEVVDGVNRS